MTASSTRKLFGTDGIRAIAGQAPLDPKTIYSVGLALAHSLHKSQAKPKVLLGRDTRESGPWIAATLAAGLREAGAQVESAGIVTTPAVAFLARTHGFQAGVVISASHNPWADNGIKLFGADGFKFPDAVELAMEDEILHHASRVKISDAQRFPAVEDNPSLQADYIQFLIDCVPGLSLSHLQDCGRLRQRRGCSHCAGALPAPRSWRTQQHHPAPHRARRPQHQRRLRRAASGARGRRSEGARRGSGCDLRRRRRPLHAGRPARQRDQRRRHSVDGGARPESARHVDRKSRGRNHHVEHGPGSGLEAQRHPHGARRRGRSLRTRRDAEAECGPGRRAVRPHSLPSPGDHRAMAF